MVQCKIIYNDLTYTKIYDSDHIDIKKEVNRVIDSTPLATLYDNGHIILYTKDYVMNEKIIVGEDTLECLGDLMIDCIEIYCNTVYTKSIPISGTSSTETMYYLEDQTVQDYIDFRYNINMWYIDSNNKVRLDNYYLHADGLSTTEVSEADIISNTFYLDTNS